MHQAGNKLHGLYAHAMSQTGAASGGVIGAPCERCVCALK
jgi:hypothetical protein